MNRSNLEHIIRASAAITGANKIVVIGSQSILGPHPNAPRECLISQEADVFTFRDAKDGELVDGSIGEGSPFHSTFGYYAHGIAEETAILPPGWKSRLFTLKNENTGTGEGLCLEPHDLAVSKLAAGREKDLPYVRALLRDGFLNLNVLEQRIDSLSEENRGFARQNLQVVLAQLASGSFAP
jgi:hypothetical protein